MVRTLSTPVEREKLLLSDESNFILSILRTLPARQSAVLTVPIDQGGNRIFITAINYQYDQFRKLNTISMNLKWNCRKVQYLFLKNCGEGHALNIIANRLTSPSNG